MVVIVTFTVFTTLTVDSYSREVIHVLPSVVRVVGGRPIVPCEGLKHRQVAATIVALS